MQGGKKRSRKKKESFSEDKVFGRVFFCFGQPCDPDGQLIDSGQKGK